MDKTQFNELVTKIGTCTDDVERRTLLTQLSDETSKVFDEQETLNTTITSLNDQLSKTSEDLAKVQKANMDLFLRIGSTKSSEEIQKDSIGGEEQKEKRKFEDLFKNEK